MSDEENAPPTVVAQVVVTAEAEVIKAADIAADIAAEAEKNDEE